MPIVLQKLGHVYGASGETPWRASHAFTPTPVLISPDVIRIYVAFLDAESVGRIGYVDVAARDPLSVLAVSDRPVLDIGSPGAFDDSGVTPMMIVRQPGALWLYYTGWQLSTTVRYLLFVGLAKSTDGGLTFERYMRTPILERCNQELIVRTASCVIPGEPWRMWYIGGSQTILVKGKQVPTYDLRYLESNDGSAWSGPGKVLLRPQGDEYGFGRPWILPCANGYEMFYSIRTKANGYHLGYALSDDGLSWVRRDDDLVFRGSSAAWDRSMQAFSALVETRYGTYLFYNGNDHGRTGFGAALVSRT
jgi:hypothetical protein